MTVSVGVAGYPADGEDAETLMRKADERLYVSKKLRHARESTTAA